jgi:peroxiredoxin
VPLPVGTRAPDFALRVDPNGDPLRLGDYLGERCVVLMFFPFAYSSTCTAQMCAVAENYSAWEALEAEVIGVSIDSPYTNQRFSTDYEVPFPIASDFNKDVAAAYDAIFDELNGWRGVTRRVVYVIGRDGTIAYAWEGEHPGVMPDFEEILSAVEAAN